MASLGYCMECDKLVTIQPQSQQWGSRQCNWRPIKHNKLDGTACNGDKRDIK